MVERSISFGMEVSLRIGSNLNSHSPDTQTAFLYSPGPADPRLLIKRWDRSRPVTNFDHCVFRIEPVAQGFEGINDGVTFGKVIHLVHSFSGRYLSIVRQAATGAGKENHCQLQLMEKEEAGRACRLRLMTRYKRRGEGDTVVNKDICYLQYETGALGLNAVIADDSLEDSEATSAEDLTPFEICTYDSTGSDDNQRQSVLRAGVAALIFHREEDALLVTEGKNSALNQEVPTIRESNSRKVVLFNDGSRPAIPDSPFFRCFASPVTMLDPESIEFDCSALWFVDLTDPTVGGPIFTGKPCRIRHGATNKYLCVVKQRIEKDLNKESKERDQSASPNRTEGGNNNEANYAVVLQSLDLNVHVNNTIFELELVSSDDTKTPSLQGKPIVSASSYLRMKHHATGMYIATTALGPRSFSVTLSPEPTMEDTLAIVVVPRDRQANLTFLIGNSEFLNGYIKMFRMMQKSTSVYKYGDPEVTKVIERTSTSLESLIRFCTDSDNQDALKREGIPNASHQNSMFEVQMHKLALEVCVAPFVAVDALDHFQMPLEGGVIPFTKITSDEYAPIHEICCLVFRLLKQMSKGSMYAAQLLEYFEFMQSIEGYKLRINDTLMEIGSNNREMLKSEARCRKDIDHNITMLRDKDRSSGYIKYLSLMCICKDKGIVANQRYVCDQILIRNRSNILLPFQLGKIPKSVDENKERSRFWSTVLNIDIHDFDPTLMILVPPPKKSKSKSEKKPEADDGYKWISIEDFLREDDKKSSGDKDDSGKKAQQKLQKFFASSIELIANLCVGLDPECHRSILNAIPPENFIVALDPTRTYNDSVRASFYDVAHHLIVRTSLNKEGCDIHRKHTCGDLVMTESVTASSKFLGEEEFSEASNQKVVATDFSPSVLDRAPKELKLRNIRDDDFRAVKRLSLEQLADRSAYKKLTTKNGEDYNKLLLSLTSIWRSIVIHEAYTEEELKIVCDSVVSILSKMTQSSDSEAQEVVDPNAADYVQPELVFIKTTEKNIEFLKTKITLVRFLTDVLRHECDKIADYTMNIWANEKQQDPKSVLAAAKEKLFKLRNEYIAEKQLFPIIFNLSLHEDHELVNAALELGSLICNSGAYLSKRIQAAESVADSDISAEIFPVIAKTVFNIRKYVSPFGDIINEDPVAKEIKDILWHAEQTLSELEGQLDLPKTAKEGRIRRERGVSMKRGERPLVAFAWGGLAGLKPEFIEYSRLLGSSGLPEMLIKSLEDVKSLTDETASLLLDLFNFLFISDDVARRLARHLSIFCSLLASDKPKIRTDAALIVLSIIRSNKRLAKDLSHAHIETLVSMLETDYSGAISQGLEYITLGEYPIEKNQRQVLSTILAPEKNAIRNIMDNPKPEHASEEQYVLEKSIINLIACCCVNNSVCRTMIVNNKQHNFSSEEIINILLKDSVPENHIYPYYKLLASGFLICEEEWTTGAIRLQKLQWTNSKWWDLVDKMLANLPPKYSYQKRMNSPTLGSFSPSSGSMYLDSNPPLVAPLVFEGIIPCLTAFYKNLYSHETHRKSASSIDVQDVLLKAMEVADWVLKSPDLRGLPKGYIGAVKNLLQVLFPHCPADSKKANIRANVVEKLARVVWNIEAEEENSGDGAKDKHAIARQDTKALFNKEWEFNSQNALEPLINIFNENQCLYKVAKSTNNRCRRYHLKLINHILSFDLSSKVTVAVLASFRLALENYDGSAPVDPTDQRQRRTDSQNYLNEINILRTITEISIFQVPEVTTQAFELAIGILEEGNVKVQDTLLNYFLTHDERFFHDVERMLKLAIQDSEQHRTRVANAAYYRGYDTPLRFVNVNCTLRLLQLLCEGHHHGLQEYLRSQRDNLRSCNIVKSVSQFLSELTSHTLDKENLKLLLQALALLTEVCQGPCYGNQATLVANGIFPIIAELIQSPELHVNLDELEKSPDDEESDNRLLLMVKSNSFKLLLALMEGSSDGNIHSVLLKEMKLEPLRELTEELISTQMFIESKDELLCDLVYDIMITMHTIVNMVNRNDQIESELRVARDLLEKNKEKIGLLGRIEIERNDRIEQVYFRVPAACSLITEETKNRVFWAIDRSTQGSKLSDFLDKADEVIYDVQWLSKSMESNVSIKALAKFPLAVWDDLSLITAVIINVLFVFVMSDAERLLDTETDWMGIEGLIRIFAYVQLGITSIALILDGVLNFPLISYKRKKLLKKDLTIVQKIKAWMNRSESLYRIASLLFSICGFWYSELFFAFHLLGTINKSSVLKNVVVAVTQNGRSLLLTGLLGCMFVYLFTIVAFVGFRDHFEDSACESLAACVLHILTTGLRQGGGIGDQMTKVNNSDPNYMSRVVFDFLFWAFMIVIFLNILFGIIIDTFAELRDEKSKKEEDMHTRCFICGIDSYTFDRYGQGFPHHQADEHNVWQYLYFFHHLTVKEPTEYNGQESYVAKCIKDRDICFFPNNKCTSLKNIKIRSEVEDPEADAEVEERGITHANGAPLTKSAESTTANLVENESVSLNDEGNANSTLNMILQKLEILERSKFTSEEYLTLGKKSPNVTSNGLSPLAQTLGRRIATQFGDQRANSDSRLDDPEARCATLEHNMGIIKEELKRKSMLQSQMMKEVIKFSQLMSDCVREEAIFTMKKADLLSHSVRTSIENSNNYIRTLTISNARVQAELDGTKAKISNLYSANSPISPYRSSIKDDATQYISSLRQQVYDQSASRARTLDPNNGATNSPHTTPRSYK